MMKKLLFLVAAAVAGVSFAEQADHWTYNGSTITDGEWTFAATVKNDTEMTVGDYSQYPASGILNFAKPVKDAAGTTYTIVKLNPHLCTGTDYRSSSASAASKAVTELYLPATGLTEISGGAFGFMTNCTKVEPFIPDSVVTLGEGSFDRVACMQDVRLIGVCGTIGIGTFTASKITSVTFGPGLKKIYDWSVGPFTWCSELTNVTFSSEMTDAYFDGIRDSGFNNCSKLKGTVDLTGFSDLSYVSDSGGNANPFSGTGLNTVIIGADCTKLGAKFFYGMGSLTTVKFMGPPPEIIKTAKDHCRTSGKLFDDKGADKTVVVYIKEEYKDAWAPYSATGEINDTDSKWSKDWVGNADCYLLLEGGGGGGGELGYWVYDSQKQTVSCELGWEFNAKLTFHSLTVESCVSYPDEVSLLDFSETVTDELGNKVQIVALNTAFSTGDMRFPAQTDAGQKVGELRLPESGLLTLGKGAFGLCKKLTKIVNYIPDSVTSIGEGVFDSVPAEQDLRLYGISGADIKAFNGAGITSVTFGPNLKKLRTYNGNCFGGCTHLTNVTFDAAMSGAKFTGSHMSHFAGCSKLAGTIDLSGFSNLNDFSQGGDGAFKGTLVEKVILGADLTTINAKFLGGMTKLSEVVFQGEPPATIGTPYLNGNSATQKITTWVHKKDKAAWAPYAANGVILHKGSTWAADYVSPNVSDLKLRPLLVADMIDGLMLIVK